MKLLRVELRGGGRGAVSSTLTILGMVVVVAVVGPSSTVTLELELSDSVWIFTRTRGEPFLKQVFSGLGLVILTFTQGLVDLEALQIPLTMVSV